MSATDPESTAADADGNSAPDRHLATVEVESQDLTPKPGLLSTLTRWVLIVHAALIVAQPFIAGAMLDGASSAAHTWHLNLGMFLAAFGFVQVVVTAIAWKGAGWSQNAFTGSIAIWFLEIAQFFIGYLGMPLAMHIPLGVLLIIAILVMVWLYARRAPLPAP